MPTPETAKGADPILIDLGKKSRKAIRRLRRGKGKLMDEVSHCIQELRNSSKIAGNVQPVVVIVRQKPANLLGW